MKKLTKEQSWSFRNETPEEDFVDENSIGLEFLDGRLPMGQPSVAR